MLSTALILFALTGVSSADVIRPAPDTPCPQGSLYEHRGHGGYWCAPTAPCEGTCETEGQVCSDGPIGICVETKTRRSGGRRPSEPFDVEVATGSCATDDDCTGEATCVIGHRCLEEGENDPNRPPEPAGDADEAESSEEAEPSEETEPEEPPPGAPSAGPAPDPDAPKDDDNGCSTLSAGAAGTGGILVLLALFRRRR